LNTNIAKQIGQRVAIKLGLVGLSIAYLLFAAIMFSWDLNFKNAFFWIADVGFKLHLFVGALGLLITAYFFGQLAGVEILIKGRNYLLTGIKYSILTLITSILIGSSVGFLQEGIKNMDGFDAIYDYYFKPLFWVTMFGILPAIIVGLFFGRQIKKQGLRSVEQMPAV
jgi:hypothetical protein